MPSISGINMSAWQSFGLILDIQKCQSNVNCRPVFILNKSDLFGLSCEGHAHTQQITLHTALDLQA